MVDEPIGLRLAREILEALRVTASGMPSCPELAEVELEALSSAATMAAIRMLPLGNA